jgi:transcriptional regulator with XRE-family HTH domain
MTAKQLRGWRALMGWTQLELARRLGLSKPGTSGRVRVARWEAGVREIPELLPLALKGLESLDR